jgi:hypothetical protein
MAETLILIASVIGLLAAGYGLALYRVRAERARLAAWRQVVQGEFVALQQVQRVHNLYFQARDALRRSGRPPGSTA